MYMAPNFDVAQKWMAMDTQAHMSLNNLIRMQ